MTWTPKESVAYTLPDQFPFNFRKGDSEILIGIRGVLEANSVNIGTGKNSSTSTEEKSRSRVPGDKLLAPQKPSTIRRMGGPSVS